MKRIARANWLPIFLRFFALDISPHSFHGSPSFC